MAAYCPSLMVTSNIGNGILGLHSFPTPAARMTFSTCGGCKGRCPRGKTPKFAQPKVEYPALPRLCLGDPLVKISYATSSADFLTEPLQCPKMRNLPNAATKTPTIRKNIFTQLKGYFPAMAPV